MALTTIETGIPLVTEDTITVADDYVLFLDGSATGNANKEQFSDVMTLIAGTGLSASSGVLNVDADQTGITSLGTQVADVKVGNGYGLIVGHTAQITAGGQLAELQVANLQVSHVQLANWQLAPLQVANRQTATAP